MHCLHVFDVSRISYHSTLKQQAPTHCFTCMVEKYLDCTAKKDILAMNSKTLTKSGLLFLSCCWK